jgi:hypothetical protein
LPLLGSVATTSRKIIVFVIGVTWGEGAIGGNASVIFFLPKNRKN